MEQRLLPAQLALLQATERLIAFVAGYGAGKTHSALLKAIALATYNPGCDGAFIEPTFKMAKQLAFLECIRLLQELKISFKKSIADLYLELWVGETEQQWTRIYFMSADKPDSLDGMNLAWAILDEAGQCKEEVAKKLLARIRHPRAALHQLVIVGTPEGGPGTWYGQWAEFGAPGVVANKLIRARTFDNPFLPEAYLRDMESRYTPEEFRGYCEGYFIAAGGQVYRWKPETSMRDFVEVPYPSIGEVQVFADFNVSKVVWLLAWTHGGVCHVFDEVVSTNTYTDEQAIKVRERLQKWGVNPNGVCIYHDANVSNRSATASKDRTGRSDVYRCREAGFTTKAQRTNPPIRDRIGAVNRKLKEGTLKVAPRCKELLISLATQGRDKHGQPDKSGGLDHAVDALGYGVYWQWPIQPRQTIHGSRLL